MPSLEPVELVLLRLRVKQDERDETDIHQDYWWQYTRENVVDLYVELISHSLSIMSGGRLPPYHKPWSQKESACKDKSSANDKSQVLTCVYHDIAYAFEASIHGDIPLTGNNRRTLSHQKLSTPTTRGDGKSHVQVQKTGKLSLAYQGMGVCESHSDVRSFRLTYGVPLEGASSDRPNFRPA